MFCLRMYVVLLALVISVGLVGLLVPLVESAVAWWRDRRFDADRGGA